MKHLFKLGVIIVVALLLIGSAYVIFFRDQQPDDTDGETPDTTLPTIDFMTGDASGTVGKITTISATFSDNIGVTEATLYYKSADASIWSSTSILNGAADITIPSGSLANWYYYVTVNDAAGNGPVGDPSVDGSTYYTITVTQNNQNLVHTVFIEEGTATWCTNCPTVSAILHDLYISGKYNFYYVALIEDKNSKAKARLENDYNILGYPTVFVDGGFEVIFGASNPASMFEEQIQKAMQRDVPKIALNVTSLVNETGKTITTSVRLNNYETSAYNGHLRVYLAERVSVQDYSGNPYQFGLVDYILDEDVTAPANGVKVVDGSYDASALDVENLMVIAVVFHSEPIQKYSDFPGKNNSFDAYYADASAGTVLVQGGNLPPAVGITNPKNGRLHLLGKPILTTPKLKTILIGTTKITVQASDDSAVEKVEFYIDDKLMKTVTAEPYEYRWMKPSWLRLKHTIKVVAYDDQGKSSAATLDVTAFMFL